MNAFRNNTLLLVGMLPLAIAAQADITAGMTLPATGPAALRGISEKNTVSLMSKTIASQNSLCLALLIAREVLQVVSSLRRHGVSVLLIEQNARALLHDRQIIGT